MAHKPKIDQNLAPSKTTLGGISPQAITCRQIELESCPKTREVVYNKKIRFSSGCLVFLLLI